MKFVPQSAAIAAEPFCARQRLRADVVAHIHRAAEFLAAEISQGRAIDSKRLSAVMTNACGGTDAEGFWLWKDAYEACEAATVLTLRKLGPAMRARAQTPAALLAMLAKIAALLPTHTRRSEESQALQQFSTPIGLGFVASVAAGITSNDLVLEPSAGTGLLAIFADLEGAKLALNEFSPTRAALLESLFPGSNVTRFDAAAIHDHLDESVRPTIVLMNPPFSVGIHVEGRVRNAALLSEHAF